MKKPDEYEILEREHEAAGAHMMQKSPRADELIACLEGEIAKRDARILELESDLAGTQSRVLSLQDQWRKLDAELAALKAQDTAGEVVGWYRLDRPYEMTSYPSVCATWHKLGAPVAPLYASPAAPAADAPPENCRQRLAAEGKPYPRSSCAVCGKFSPKLRECDAALAAHRSTGVV